MTHRPAPAGAYAEMSRQAREVLESCSHYGDSPPSPTVASGRLLAGIQGAFEALADPEIAFEILPCAVNGAPAGLIVHTEAIRGGMRCTPFFVSVAEGMRITTEDGQVIFGPD